MIEGLELRMPMFATSEINLRHLEPMLFAITDQKHLLWMIYNEDPLVGKNVRLCQVPRTFRADETVPVSEVFSVVNVLQVVNVLIWAEVVLIVDVGFTDGRLSLNQVILQI